MRERACARARRCVPAGMFLPWTCVGARKRVSASIALPQSSTVADAAQITHSSPNCSVPSRLVVDDVQPAPPYAPDNTSHAIRNRSPSNPARRISTRAIDATQETARYRSAAGQRRQRICSQAAQTVDAKASLTWEQVRKDTRSESSRTGPSVCSIGSQDTVGRLSVIASRNSARGVHCVQLNPSLT